MRRWARSHGPAASFTSGELSVDFERREVRVGGELVHLTPKEYDLLKYMIEHAGKALTHRTLLTAVWGVAHARQAQYLRVFVSQLRKKIEPNLDRPVLILTEPGVGYKFCAEPCVTAAGGLADARARRVPWG
jgi:two-component system KDP operon response regulator KdpE